VRDMNIIAYGGGVQSVALLILNALGEVEPRATSAVFADTGSEMPETLNHIHNEMRPWAKSCGIPIEIVRCENGPLHKYIAEGNIVIPAYGDRGGMVYRRCTDRWKIVPIKRWLRAHGAKTATLQLGISLDEFHRMSDSPLKWLTHLYPLVDKRITRQDCMNIIKREGLSVPPRSACWMCPYRSLSAWHMMKKNNPREFKKAVELEKTMDGLFLRSERRPLDTLIGEQATMFENDECGGYCWT